MTSTTHPKVDIQSLDLRRHLVTIVFDDVTWQYCYRSRSAAEVGVAKRIALRRYPARAQQTVDEFAAEWLRDYVDPECDRFTFKDYRSCAAGLVSPYLGKMRIDHLSSSTVDVLLKRLNEEGGYHSVHRGLRTFSAMLTVAESWGYIPANPALRRKRRSRLAR